MIIMAGKNDIPMFLAKLWNLVEDPSTDHLIRWSSEGTSFVVSDPAKFAKELLPQYFKHRNIASFIRVLNMYEFRKVVKLESGSLRSNKDDMEFRHPYFVRGHEHLLIMIKRKPPASHGIPARATPDAAGLILAPPASIPEQEVTRVLSDVRSLRNNQESMDAKLEKLKQENETMWAELQDLRTKHQHQQIVVNKLIEFFVTLLHSTGNMATSLRAPPPQLAIQSLTPPGTVAPPGKRPRIDSGAIAVPDASAAENGAPAQNHNYNGPVIRDITDAWSAAYSQQEPMEVDWDRLLHNRIADLNGRMSNGPRKLSTKQAGPGQPGTPRPVTLPSPGAMQMANSPACRPSNALVAQQQNALAVQALQKITPDQIASLRNIPVATNAVARSIPVPSNQVAPVLNQTAMSSMLSSLMSPPPQSSSPVNMPTQIMSSLDTNHLENQVDTMQSRLDSIRDCLQDPSYNLDLSQLLTLFSDTSTMSPSGSQIPLSDPLLALENGNMEDGQDSSHGLLDMDHEDFMREFENLPSDDLIEGVTIQIPEYPGEVPPSTIPLSQPHVSVPAITGPSVKAAPTKRKRK